MGNKKKLLFVIPTMRIGGAEKALLSLLKALDPARVEVDLFLFEQGGELQQEIPNWISILPENRITRAMILELRYYFKDIIRAKKPAAAAHRLEISLRAGLRNKLHCKPCFSWAAVSRYIDTIPGHYDVAIGFLEGFTDYFILDKVCADCKVGWIHTDFSKRALLPEDIEYYCRFDRIATITEACKKAFEAAVPGTEGRVFVVENLVLPEDVLSKAMETVSISWDPSKKHLITIGRLEEVKGIDLAIRACRILRDQDVPVCWHVFGEGSKKEQLTKLIEELQLRDCFILEGSVSNPLPYAMAADVFVQPSRQEGKSIALDEAKILGKPIVVTNYPSVEDQVENQVTGIITETQPESIAEGILFLLNNPEKCSEFSRNCSATSSSSRETLEKFYQVIGLKGVLKA